MPDRSDTLVFVPAWNEEENIAAVLDELRDGLPQADVLVVDDGSTTERPRSPRAGGRGDLVRRQPRPPAGIAAGYEYAVEQGYEFCGRVDADGQHPVEELARLLERVRSGVCDVAVGSRFASGDGYAAYRYAPSGARRFGTAVLRRSMKVALRRSFLDATSGMYAANAKALPILARPYTSEAPEVQALLRLEEEGLRVDEVPVDMRPRAGGESKLRGKKAVLVVLTIVGTLLALERWRRR